MNPFDNLTTSKPVPYDRNQKSRGGSRSENEGMKKIEGKDW